MKRRTLLRNLGLGVSGGYLLPGLLSSCEKDEPGPEIVYSGTVAIIGAGPAGLYTADILRSKGVKVDIYEARDQIGGRVRSLRNQSTDTYPKAPLMSSEFPIELGAEIIKGSNSIFGKIYTDYNLPTVEFDPSTNAYVMDLMAKNSTEWGADPDFVAAMNFISGLSGQAGSPKTVQQAITDAGINSRAHNLLNGSIGNPFGSTNSVLGIGATGEDIALAPTDGKLITLKANPMQDALISRFSEVQAMVKLNTPIESIAYGPDPITLRAKDGTEFTANLVIVTVPISIIKSGGISFSPVLPGSFTSGLAKLNMGPCIRLVIEFKKNFWGECAYIVGSENAPTILSSGKGRGQFNATLSVTVYGPKAATLSALNDPEAQLDAVLADLDAIYAGQATQFIRVDPDKLERIYVVDDWTNREYIKGGFSYPLAGATSADRSAIGAPINDKLFFAGEATDISGQAGTVNGALASAERVAKEVIDVIKAM